MAILHTVNKSPLTHNVLNNCFRLATLNDGILLIEDGVYGAINNSLFTPTLELALNQFNIYVLHPDLAARGILGQVHPKVVMVDYAGFVDLTVRYDKIQTWF